MRSRDIFDFYHIDAVYHMTHIDNVVSILEHGLLAHGNGRTQMDISNRSVNVRRMRREPIHHKSIHSYVPFYINPTNAMLYSRKDMQDDIVIFAFDRELINESDAIFTDGNAASASTHFYSDIDALSKLSWRCLNGKSWYNHHDGRRTRMAEVLVQTEVSIKRLDSIICNSYDTFMRLKALVGDTIEVRWDEKFYF